MKLFSRGIVLIIYILRQSSFWRPFYFKSFQNAKICRYTLRNDNENEVSQISRETALLLKIVKRMLY